MAKKKNKYAAAAAKAVNGCPLMDGRNKSNLADYEGTELVIEDAYKMTGDDGTYYCIICEDMADEYFFTSSQLTNAIAAAESAAAEDGEDLTAAVAGLTFVVDGLKKTSNGRKFRPVRILTDN